MPTPQSFQNHGKLDTLHHFIITPLLILNFAYSFVVYDHHHRAFPAESFWWVVLSFTLILGSIKMRLYSLRNQDRLIRLEERLRLTALLPASEHPLIANLTTPQLIALRFASDAELAPLARRTLAENLAPKQIKESILTWRPDHERI